MCHLKAKTKILQLMAPFALSLLFQLVPQKQYPSQQNWVIHTNRGSERAQRNQPEDKALYFRVWQRKGKMDLKAGFPTKPAAKRGMKDTASCNKDCLTGWGTGVNSFWTGIWGLQIEMVMKYVWLINYSFFNHSFIHSFTHAYITTSKTLIHFFFTDSKNIVKMNIECVHIFLIMIKNK